MNLAEKIAATYLRLNGFLLLPHFTVFNGDHHGHVDLVGLRAAGSKELSRDLTFPTDDTFFKVAARYCERPRDQFLGLVAEVRTNENQDNPKADQVNYVRNFLGGIEEVMEVAFIGSNAMPAWDGGCITIGNSYALKWIIERVCWIDDNHTHLSKSGSWILSDDALADFLVLHRYGEFDHVV